jgi:2-dehydro-3-deoxyphosphogalactonate aldolase
VDLSSWLRRYPIVAILRGIKPEEAESICTALEEAGIVIVEAPLNSPNALSSIATVSRAFSERMLIGAGTLTDPTQVTEVAAAGGRLIVTPHADTAIVRAAKTANLFAVPGFFNPTEAFALLRAGADAIKLFPSEVLWIPMLKALQAVLPKDTIVIPVGRIDAEKIAPWMAVRALGVGVGSSVYKRGDTALSVEAKAKVLMDAVRAYQSSAQVGKL